MKELFALSIGIVIAIVSLMIGASVMNTTYTTTASTSNSTALHAVWTNGGTAFTTFAGFIPVVVIAGVGGLALMYLISYVGGMGDRSM